MAEKVPIPRLLVTSCPAKKGKKRKTFLEKAAKKRSLDLARGKTKICIGTSFERWRQLKEDKGLKTDAMVAELLLDSYNCAPSTSTPWKDSLVRLPNPAVSTVAPESLSERDDNFSVAGVQELDISGPEETALQQLDSRYCRLFNKKSKKWSLYTVKEDKDYGYIPDLQSAILRKRLSAVGGLPRTITRRPDDPRQYGVLSGVPAPATQDLLQRAR
ncbi:uncharacterized protein LOC114460682 [Gouania willdenowi]|uniref:uncharacterized protein LOC114460682 n=1 Tax=Gouania willdenowi TaxID=441366 RepID=UPI001056D328|nr:uncharacterized protein LOC114460682 [Gouania willdenowi]